MAFSVFVFVSYLNHWKLGFLTSHHHAITNGVDNRVSFVSDLSVLARLVIQSNNTGKATVVQSVSTHIDLRCVFICPSITCLVSGSAILYSLLSWSISSIESGRNSGAIFLVSVYLEDHTLVKFLFTTSTVSHHNQAILLYQIDFANNSIGSDIYQGTLLITFPILSNSFFFHTVNIFHTTVGATVLATSSYNHNHGIKFNHHSNAVPA